VCDDRRKERLQNILARENDKHAFQNKVEKSFPTAKLRDLKLSATDGATGSVKIVKSRVAPSEPAPPEGYEPKTTTSSRRSNRHTLPAQHAGTIHGETSKPMLEAPIRRPTWGAVPTGLTDNSWIPKQLDVDAPPPLPGKRKPKGEWTILRQFESALSNVDQVTRKRMQEKEVLEHRSFLDHQRMEKERMMVMAREQEEREAERMRTDLEKWKLEEAHRKEVRKQKDQMLKRLQDEQLEKLRQDRAEEAARIRAQEDEAVDLAKRQIEMQREREKRKKAAELDKMKADQRYVAEQIAIKAKRKEDSRKEDIRMQHEYQALLEKQDKAREAAAAERTRKANARAVAAGGNLEAEAAARKETEESRIRKHQEALAKALHDKEVAQSERRSREMHEIHCQLQDQLKRKEEQAAAAREEKERYKAMMAAKDAMEREREATQVQARRQKNLRHKHELVQQMHINRMKEKPDECMTQQEVLINAPLLTRAQEIMAEAAADE